MVPPSDRRGDRQEEVGGEIVVPRWPQELRLVQQLELLLLATRTASLFSSPRRRDQLGCPPTMEMVVVLPWRNIRRYRM